jgi:predicted permease
MPTLTLLLPDLLTIGLGFALFRSGFLQREIWDAAEKLVYFVLFPALLFNAVAHSPLDPRAATSLIGASLLVTAAGVGLGWLARLALVRGAGDLRVWAGCAQTAFRFNSYVALSLAARLDNAGQAAGLFALVIAFNVPLCNTFAVLALSTHQKTSLLRELARNPLIIATTAGLLFKVSGLDLPELAWFTLGRLGQAALALGLMAVGAGLSWHGARSAWPMVSWMLAARALVLPLVAFLVAHLLQLDGMARTVLIAFAALPTASSAYILASRMGAPGAPVAAIISIGTLVACFTLPLWLGAL